MSGAARKVAVVLLNLGGPQGPDAVEPFLKNLFADPAIIGLPGVLRLPLASIIARRRGAAARANYALMGGGSPLLRETQAQAAALTAALGESGTKVFIAMRYWRPQTDETAAAVAAFAPDEIMLLPLYPQFSTTTTASSLAAWADAYRGPGRVRTVCCYPTSEALVGAHATAIQAAWAASGQPANVRLIFSAHGLPERVVARGDPYQSQVEASAAAVAARLPALADWTIAYQSRVGPLRWLGPSTLAEIERAAGEGLGVIVSPIAFVSEHIETLVELDHDYRMKAEAAGCPAYIRVPALGADAVFIEGLAAIVAAALANDAPLAPGSAFTCAMGWSKCPYPRRDGA